MMMMRWVRSPKVIPIGATVSILTLLVGLMLIICGLLVFDSDDMDGCYHECKVTDIECKVIQTKIIVIWNVTVDCIGYPRSNETGHISEMVSNNETCPKYPMVGSSNRCWNHHPRVKGSYDWNRTIAIEEIMCVTFGAILSLMSLVFIPLSLIKRRRTDDLFLF